jgi:hypothetical protein
MSNWNELFSTNKPAVVRNINGKPLSFRKLSVKSILTIKRISPALTKALAFFKDQNEDVVERNVVWSKDTNVDGSTSEKSSRDFKPITLDSWITRIHQRQDAYQSLVDSLLGDEFKNVVFDVIKSSMRDYFHGPQSPSAEQFYEAVDVGTIIEIFKGIADANPEIIKPFLPMIRDIQKEVMPQSNIIPMDTAEPAESTTQTTGQG